MNSPNINLDLKVPGLEDYYKPKPKIFNNNTTLHHVDKLE